MPEISTETIGYLIELVDFELESAEENQRDEETNHPRELDRIAEAQERVDSARETRRELLIALNALP